jgi:hypothetical protein
MSGPVRPAKDSVEEGLKDLFISLLAEMEGTTYFVEARNVKTRGGEKNSDYLLREVSSGSSLALEITLLFDSTNDARTSRLHNVAQVQIENEISRQSDAYADLPGWCLIELPRRTVPETIVKQLAPEAAEQIIEVAKTAPVGIRQELATSIGDFAITWHEGPRGLLFARAEGFNWSDDKYEISIIKSRLLETLSRKNDQLDVEADRRVLLIGRAPGLPQREPVIDAAKPVAAVSVCQHR